jgi:hypothetical protein
MSKPPAITQKVAIRAVLCLFLLALLLAGYQCALHYKDPGELSVYNSLGMILAVRSRTEGSQVVLIKPDGTILESPKYPAGKTDRDAVWRPDGNTVLFSSDRDGDVFNMYRWNLMTNAVERRSFGTRSRLAPYFSPDDKNSALIVAGGSVQEFTAADGSSLQVLPPIPRGASENKSEGEGSGSGAQFDSAYQGLGSSFRIAKWGKDKDWVIAVMRGEENEVLILQSLTQNAPPIPVISAHRIDFDVDPRSGGVWFTAQGLTMNMPDAHNISKEEFQAAQRSRAALLANPNRIGFVDPATLGSRESAHRSPWLVSGGKGFAFGTPAISPDGSTLLVVGGAYTEGVGLTPNGLFSFSVSGSTTSAPTVIVKGEVLDPAWSPSGDRICYVRRVGNERAVCTNAANGGDEKVLTQGKGDFSSPLFSPQTKK